MSAWDDDQVLTDPDQVVARAGALGPGNHGAESIMVGCDPGQLRVVPESHTLTDPAG
jgi:hypothetical protein